MENFDNLISWYDKHKEHTEYHNGDSEYIEIKKITEFLDPYYDEIRMQQRIWHIKNNKFEIQKCRICAKPLKFRRRHGYKLHCDECNMEHDNECRKHGYYLSLIKKYGQDVYDKTNFLLEKYQNPSFAHRIWHMKNDVWEFQYCKQCGRLMTYGARRGYYRCNHKECMFERAKKTNLEKYGAESHSKSNQWRIPYLESNRIYLERNGYGNYAISHDTHGYKLQCPKCEHSFKYSSVTKKRVREKVELCTYCNPLQKGYSPPEKNLLEFIKIIYSGEIIENDRKVIHPLELDIYIPQLSLVFEFNGDYYHSNPKFYKSHDMNKTLGLTAQQIWDKDDEKRKLCEAKGLEFHVVWEDDWKTKQHQVGCEIFDILDTRIDAYTNFLQIYFGEHNVIKNPKNADGNIISDYAIKGLGMCDQINSKFYDLHFNIGKFESTYTDSDTIQHKIYNIKDISNFLEIFRSELIYDGTDMAVMYNQDVFYKTEKQLWSDNALMKNGENLRYVLLKNRLQFFKSPPKSEHATHNIFELGDKDLLSGFTISGIYKGYTKFKTNILSKVLKEFDIKMIYDPCGGWGHRILSFKNSNAEFYIYNDINLEVMSNCKKMVQELGCEDRVKFMRYDAAERVPRDNYDCVFTCPPYHDSEIYTTNGAENLEYAEFIQWWKTVITKCFIKKKSAKILSYVINGKLHDDFLNVAENLGLNLYKTVQK